MIFFIWDLNCSPLLMALHFNSAIIIHQLWQFTRLHFQHHHQSWGWRVLILTWTSNGAKRQAVKSHICSQARIILIALRRKNKEERTPKFAFIMSGNGRLITNSPLIGLSRVRTLPLRISSSGHPQRYWFVYGTLSSQLKRKTLLLEPIIEAKFCDLDYAWDFINGLCGLFCRSFAH